MIFSWCPWTRAVRRGRENAAAVAARALRAAPARSETAARHALERDRESLVEREKLLSKQLSRRETTGWSGWSELVRQAEALAAGWSDDETTSDRPDSDSDSWSSESLRRMRTRKSDRARDERNRPERKMTGKRWEEMRAKLDAATVRAVRRVRCRR